MMHPKWGVETVHELNNVLDPDRSVIQYFQKLIQS